MTLTLIVAAIALILGGLGGYLIFRYGLTGKYKQMMANAEREAEDSNLFKNVDNKDILVDNIYYIFYPKEKNAGGKGEIP